jgi:hypothetical protein
MHGVRVIGDALQELEEKGEHALHHPGRRIAGHIGHGDAALGGRIHIHDVVAGGQHADVAAVRQLADDLPVERSLVGEHDLGRLGAGQDVLLLRPFVQLDLAQRAQALPRQIARAQRISIQHDDFHGQSLVPSW